MCFLLRRFNPGKKNFYLHKNCGMTAAEWGPPGLSQSHPVCWHGMLFCILFATIFTKYVIINV